MVTPKCSTCGAPLSPPRDALDATCPFCKNVTSLRAARAPDVVVATRPTVAVLGVVAAAGLGFLFVRSTPSGKPGAENSTAQVVTSTPQPPPVPAPAPTREPAVPAPAEVEPDAPHPGEPAADALASIERGPVTLVWQGRVRTSMGAAPRAGSPCTLTVQATSTGTQAHSNLTSLQCGGQVLYDSTVKLEGMASMSFGLGEAPVAGKTGTYVNVVSVQDIGTRSGPRAQITADTRQKTVEVFRDSLPSFRLSVKMDEFSLPRRGKPLFTESVPAFADVVTLRAKITSRSGNVPFGGASCDLTVSPAYATGHTCRVVLVCGGKLMYGTGNTGYNHCLLQDGRPVSFVDAEPTATDTDPELQADLNAGTGTLSDTTAAGATYLVGFSLAK